MNCRVIASLQVSAYDWMELLVLPLLLLLPMLHALRRESRLIAAMDRQQSAPKRHSRVSRCHPLQTRHLWGAMGPLPNCRHPP